MNADQQNTTQDAPTPEATRIAMLERRDRIARVLMDFAPDIIYQLDETGAIEFINHAVTALGWTPEELIGRNILDLIDLPAGQSDALKRVMTQRTGDRATRNLRLRLKAKEGNSKPFDIRDVCFSVSARGVWNVSDEEISRPTKAFLGTLGIARNVTTQVETEEALKTAYRDVQQKVEEKTRDLLEANEALQASTSRIQLLFDNAADAIFIHNIAGHFLEVNQTALDRLGYTRAELLSMSPYDIDSETFQPRVHERIQEMVAKGTMIFETEHATKDGRIIPVECSSRIIDYNDDTAVLTIARDISEKRATHKKQEQLERDLLHAQKMDAIGSVAGCVAHDINNRLTVVTGYLEIMLENDSLPENMRHDLLEIRKAADRSVALNRQLLTFARKQESVPIVLDPTEVLGSLRNFLRGLLPENIQLVAGPFPHGILIKADQGQLEQVIVNLVVNARDAMRDGGTVKIDVSRLAVATPRCIGVTNPPAGTYVRLSVADDGTGISDDLKQRVFEPFFTTKPKGEGTGLGLSVVYGIVRQHGGWVDVANATSGRGTVFHVYLPAHAAERTAADDRTEDRPDLSGAGERILLVEDEEQLLNCSAKILSLNGYKVLPARTAMEALKQFSSYGGDFHLVISDVVLPDLPAEDLLERLRLLNPALPVVFTSGYASDRSPAVRRIEADYPFLPKPFDTKDLLTMIRKTLKP
jgi:two-component system cell cycle sensor histidine kinase/response regulator CckA